MKISVARLPVDGLPFQHAYEPDELSTSEHEFALKEPPRVEGRIDKSGMDLRVRGHIKTLVDAPCDRCLTEVVIPTEIPFDLFYTPREAGSARTGEVELHERDLDFSFYENEQINLDELVLEQIALSLPNRLLCREDCRGLCAQCGTDLNVEQCQCPPIIDPRWQALAELQDETEES